MHPTQIASALASPTHILYTALNKRYKNFFETSTKYTLIREQDNPLFCYQSCFHLDEVQSSLKVLKPYYLGKLNNYNIIQIMNVYECDGKNIFMR